MRIAWLWKGVDAGSRYKHRLMFSRLGEVIVNPSRSNLAACDFAVCFGDKWKDYQKLPIPYVLVEHDVYSLRMRLDNAEWERDQVSNAAAVIFTSQDHRDWLAKRIDLPPHVVVHSRPLLADLDFEPLPKIPRSVVYAGGLLVERSKDGPFGYRCYHEMFRVLMEAGWQIHAYQGWREVANRDVVEEYGALGVTVHDPVSQRALYRELSQYTVGLQAYADGGAREYPATCRPNKLWEYLAAGIPTLGYNSGAMMDIYDGRWGCVAKSLAGLPRAAAKAARMPIPDYLRREQTIDGDLDAFRFVAEIAAAATPPVPEYTYTLGTKQPFEFRGRVWNPGDTVTHRQAVAMRDAGHLAGKGLRA